MQQSPSILQIIIIAGALSRCSFSLVLLSYWRIHYTHYCSFHRIMNVLRGLMAALCIRSVNGSILILAFGSLFSETTFLSCRIISCIILHFPFSHSFLLRYGLAGSTCVFCCSCLLIPFFPFLH